MAIGPRAMSRRPNVAAAVKECRALLPALSKQVERKWVESRITYGHNQNQRPLFELVFYRVNGFRRSSNVTLEKAAVHTYYSLWPLETS